MPIVHTGKPGEAAELFGATVAVFLSGATVAVFLSGAIVAPPSTTTGAAVGGNETVVQQVSPISSRIAAQTLAGRLVFRATVKYAPRHLISPKVVTELA